MSITQPDVTADILNVVWVIR